MFGNVESDFPACVQLIDDVPSVDFTYLVLTSIPGESYRRGLGFLLLGSCDVFGERINSLRLLILLTFVIE